jgi:hypothetical protein
MNTCRPNFIYEPRSELSGGRGRSPFVQARFRNFRQRICPFIRGGVEGQIIPALSNTAKNLNQFSPQA